MHNMMTPKQVAQYLQATTDTVYRLIRADKLAAVRVGRVYRISRQDLDRYLASNSNQPAVRNVLFRRVLQAAERNPGVNSDDVLEELEREDAERSAKAHA